MKVLPRKITSLEKKEAKRQAHARRELEIIQELRALGLNPFKHRQLFR